MGKNELLNEYIKKRTGKNKPVEKPQPQLEEKIPWYKRPIFRDEFIVKKGKDNKYYLKHNEWKPNIWVGTYDTIKECNEIIDSYVNKSLKQNDNLKLDSRIHSVIIDNEKDFFKNKTK